MNAQEEIKKITVAYQAKAFEVGQITYQLELLKAQMLPILQEMENMHKKVGELQAMENQTKESEALNAAE